MANPVRTSPITSTTATSHTATYSEGTALDSTHLHIARVKRSASGVNPAPNTPAGWTLVSSGSRQSAGAGNYSGYNVWVGFFTRQGDGSVNSITVTGANSAWGQIILTATDNYKAPGHITSDVPSATVGNAASATIDGPDPGGVDALVLGIMGLTGTAGGSGITNSSGFTNEGGQSPSSGTYFGRKSVNVAGEQDLALAWTTAGQYAGLTLAIDNSVPSTPIVASAAVTGGSIEVTLTADSGGPITSVTAAIVSGPPGYSTSNVSITGAVATCDEVPGRTAAIVIDFTVHNASSSDVVRVTLPVPGGNPVTILDKVLTGSGWVGV